MPEGRLCGKRGRGGGVSADVRRSRVFARDDKGGMGVTRERGG